MKLIIGLGNPGKEYINTRHNCGFMAIDYYAEKNNLEFKNKFEGLYSQTTINGEKVIFLMPQTFMNLSGNSVIKFKNYFNIDNSDILVIYDDMDFEVGKFKIKPSGSSGGHNGIKSIIQNLGTENIPRLRIGISKNKESMVDYVLGKFSKEDLEVLNSNLNTICNIIDDFTKYDISKLMDKYNSNSR